MTRGSAPVATTTCSAVCRAPSILLAIPGLRELEGVWGTRDPRTVPLDLLFGTIQPFPSFSGNYDAAMTELRMAIADTPPPVAPTAAQIAGLSGSGGERRMHRAVRGEQPALARKRRGCPSYGLRQPRGGGG
jgi:hypothetical protein